MKQNADVAIGFPEHFGIIMSFDELFLWALDNGIELSIYTKHFRYSYDPDYRIYCATFRISENMILTKELNATTPEGLLQICEHYLEKTFSDLKMKKPRRRKKA